MDDKFRGQALRDALMKRKGQMPAISIGIEMMKGPEEKKEEEYAQKAGLAPGKILGIGNEDAPEDAEGMLSEEEVALDEAEGEEDPMSEEDSDDLALIAQKLLKNGEIFKRKA